MSALLDAFVDAVDDLTINEQTEDKLFDSLKAVIYQAGAFISEHHDGGDFDVSVVKAAAELTHNLGLLFHLSSHSGSDDTGAFYPMRALFQWAGCCTGRHAYCGARSNLQRDHAANAR